MDISAFFIPVLFALLAIVSLRKRVDLYTALSTGAAEGLSVLLHILPSLIGLLTAIYMLRASGALECIEQLLSPLLSFCGIPAETAALLLIRPASGSGALAIGTELMQTYGADSYIGRVAAVMLGSSETTFYTIAVYFGSAGIVKSRYAIPAALIGDMACFLASAFAVRLCFGG